MPGKASVLCPRAQDLGHGSGGNQRGTRRVCSSRAAEMWTRELLPAGVRPPGSVGQARRPALNQRRLSKSTPQGTHASVTLRSSEGPSSWAAGRFKLCPVAALPRKSRTNTQGEQPSGGGAAWGGHGQHPFHPGASAPPRSARWAAPSSGLARLPRRESRSPTATPKPNASGKHQVPPQGEDVLCWGDGVSSGTRTTQAPRDGGNSPGQAGAPGGPSE